MSQFLQRLLAVSLWLQGRRIQLRCQGTLSSHGRGIRGLIRHELPGGLVSSDIALQVLLLLLLLRHLAVRVNHHSWHRWLIQLPLELIS